jgi:ubiquinone biosynthesis protein
VSPHVVAQTAVTDLLTGWRLVTSLAGILLIALVVGRLLGVRRSTGVTLLSGLIGWLAGATLAVVLARNHEHGEAGFTRNLWLFSTFFTMSAVVWMEMLAKPGALARAQTSLSRIPRPVRAVRQRTQRISRYAQITRIAARYGFGRSLGMTDGDADTSGSSMAVRLRLALQEAGGMFVKAGQVLSTRSDLLPPTVARELSRLQDNVAPASRAAVEELLEAELGRPVESVFDEFDWEPLAAASIGQAHRARLQTGEDVVVKVQRPDVAELVERDLEVLTRLGHTLEARAAWAVEYRVSEQVAEFAERLRDELDFRVEARTTEEIAAQLHAFPNVRIPNVYEDLTTAKVLVLEWLDGVSVRQAEAVDAMNIDRAALADALLRSSLHQMIVDGHFHADPHPGNVLVLREGAIGLIDFGAAGRLDAGQQSSLLQMMVAVNERDAGLLRQAVLDVATVRPGFDDEQFERALARFMSRHLGSGATPSAAMFTDLLQLFLSFGLVVPAEFSTFFRALVTLEGTLTTLSPGFQVIEAAERVASEWARDRLSADNFRQLARDEVIRLAPILRRLPRQVDRLATLAARGDLRARVSLLSVPEDVKVLTRLLNRAVLALLAGVVGLISVLLIGIDGGPEFSGQTSLYEFLGYFGLFCATVLVMRVLVAILRDGLN